MEEVDVKKAEKDDVEKVQKDDAEKKTADTEKAKLKHERTKAVIAEFGCHEVMGGLKRRRLALTKDTRMTCHSQTECIPFLIKELHEGALGAVTIVVNALFNCIAPKPYKTCVQRCKALPSAQHMDTVPIGEAFTFRSILANVSIQEPISSSEAIGELTVIVPAGHFEGK